MHYMQWPAEDKQRWEMVRIAVANDRQEKLRLPGLGGEQFGLPFVRASAEGDLETLHAWQEILWPEESLARGEIF
jgi:hypothetical protein